MQRKRRVGRERSVKIGIWATPVTKAMADELAAKRGISVADLFEILIRVVHQAAMWLAGK